MNDDGLHPPIQNTSVSNVDIYRRFPDYLLKGRVATAASLAMAAVGDP
jgi:hypothetical protein